MRHPSASWFGNWVILLLCASLIVALGFSILYPYPINVRIAPKLTPLSRYDDGAGHHPLRAELLVTNVSNRTMWLLGRREMPFDTFQQRVDGKWEDHSNWSTGSADSSSKVWTALKSGESITIWVGPVSEVAAEMRVGLAFTTDKLTPTKVHWVFSPIARLVRQGEDFFWEPVEGAIQEEQVLPLP